MDIFESGKLLVRHVRNGKGKKPPDEVIDVPNQPASPESPNLTGTPSETFTEAELNRVYDDAFDQPPAQDEGYEDQSDEEIYRYIKHWTMYNRRRPKKRLPFPNNSQHFDDGTVIAGWLQPPPGPVHQLLQPVYIILDKVATFSFDRLPSLRGFWVQTDLGESWYWLQEPCDVKPPEPFTKSQAEIHFDATVALAIMSLLVDQVFTEDAGPNNAKRTVEQVLNKQHLLPIQNVPANVLYLFETSLLARCKAFIAMLLTGHIEELTDRCKFMTSLKRVSAERVDSNAKTKWVRAVAQYCHQTLWGGPLTTTPSEIEFVLERDTAVPAPVAKSAKRRSLEMTGVFDNDGSDDKQTNTKVRASRRNSGVGAKNVKRTEDTSSKAVTDAKQGDKRKPKKRPVVDSDDGSADAKPPVQASRKNGDASKVPKKVKKRQVIDSDDDVQVDAKGPVRVSRSDAFKTPKNAKRPALFDNDSEVDTPVVRASRRNSDASSNTKAKSRRSTK